MARIDKVVTRAFYTINIKLRKNNNSREASRSEYIQLIKRVYERKVHKRSSNSKHCIIKFLLDKREDGEIVYMYGRIAQFTYFENKDWFDIQTLDLDAEFTIRDGLFPDAVETDFLFAPDEHKFTFITKSSISINPYPVRRFWEEALIAVKDEGDYVHVDVVTSKEFSTKIHTAREVRRLEIDLNYSNAGIGSLSKEIIDEDLRKSNAKAAKIVATAKPNESLQIQESTILTGGIELAEEDGEASARIVDESGNLVNISTKQFPKKNFFDSNSIHLFENLYDKIKGLWPRQN